MEIRDYERENQPLFALDISIGAAVAAYCKARWPTNTHKQAAREWAPDERQRRFDGLSIDEARNVVTGRCSMRSFNTLVRHPNGGLQFLIDIGQAVTGQTIEQHLIRNRKAHVEHARRFDALVGLSRSVDTGGSIHPAKLDSTPHDRPNSVRR